MSRLAFAPLLLLAGCSPAPHPGPLIGAFAGALAGPGTFTAPSAAAVAEHPFWRHPLAEDRVEALVTRCQDPVRVQSWIQVDDSGEVIGEGGWGIGRGVNSGARFVTVDAPRTRSRAEILAALRGALDRKIASEAYGQKYDR